MKITNNVILTKHYSDISGTRNAIEKIELDIDDLKELINWIKENIPNLLIME